MKSLELEAKQFFDDFVTAFGTFSGKTVAQLFTHPYLAVDQQGVQSVFNAPEDTARYFQLHLDNYKSSGSITCSFHALEVAPIGTTGALVTVTWSLADADGNENSSWRESYCVSRKNGHMLAYASIDHVQSYGKTPLQVCNQKG